MQAVVLIGIQASGKSSFYLARFFNTHIRINLDMLRTRHRERLLIDACHAAKQAYVVDNTNPTRTDRQRYIAPAQAHGFRVAGYFFTVDLEASKRRNAQRQGPAATPLVGLLDTYKRLEPPSGDEGFDELYEVRLDATGTFAVTAFTPR